MSVVVQHVRFDDEPVAMLEIPSVFSSKGPSSHEDVGQPAGVGSSNYPSGLPDVSTRMGTQFYDRKLHRPASPDNTNPAVRGGKEFFKHDSTQVGGESPKASKWEDYPPEPSVRLAPARKAADRSGPALAANADPSVRLGTEYLDERDSSENLEDLLSATIRDTDPTVRMGTGFRSHKPAGTSSVQGAHSSNEVPDFTVRLPVVSAFKVRTSDLQQPLSLNNRVLGCLAADQSLHLMGFLLLHRTPHAASG
jgi:hypothetical protein